MPELSLTIATDCNGCHHLYRLLTCLVLFSLVIVISDAKYLGVTVCELTRDIEQALPQTRHMDTGVISAVQKLANSNRKTNEYPSIAP